jgi:alkaline phosphatase D
MKQIFSASKSVDLLSPSTAYYYQFSYKTDTSIICRTRTTPLGTSEPLEFAVISCTNYSAGFYNSLERIAQRSTLNAVIHLGDYIYEGTERDFDTHKNVPDDDEYESTHFVNHKAYWLHFFRRRYSINRLDVKLQHAHQQHPFITIWDDHETANNAYKDGAKGHAAKQAYFEWLPIRGDGASIYRSIRFGNMMELILLDTRLEGRDKQIYDPLDQALFAATRTILGQKQKAWFFDKLKSSPCLWKVIANQVIFSEINVKWADSLGLLASKLKEFNEMFLDYWEGYPAERDEVINFIARQKITNAVILSASMHCALAFDVTKRSTSHSKKGDAATYDSATGKGSAAVEFASASVTSPNFDDNKGSFMALMFQRMINRQLPIPINYKYISAYVQALVQSSTLRLYFDRWILLNIGSMRRIIKSGKKTKVLKLLPR